MRLGRPKTKKQDKPDDGLITRRTLGGVDFGAPAVPGASPERRFALDTEPEQMRADLKAALRSNMELLDLVQQQREAIDQLSQDLSERTVEKVSLAERVEVTTGELAASEAKHLQEVLQLKQGHERQVASLKDEHARLIDECRNAARATTIKDLGFNTFDEALHTVRVHQQEVMELRQQLGSAHIHSLDEYRAALDYAERRILALESAISRTDLERLGQPVIPNLMTTQLTNFTSVLTAALAGNIENKDALLKHAYAIYETAPQDPAVRAGYLFSAVVLILRGLTVGTSNVIAVTHTLRLLAEALDIMKGLNSQ